MIDQDPFDIQDWAELYKWCVSNNKKKEFIEKFTKHTKMTASLFDKRLEQYAKKALAEMYANDKENELKKRSGVFTPKDSQCC